jgi:hypothetical protein
MSYNGNLKHAAEHMCNKGLKAVFSLKSKILDFEFSSIKLKSKLFDTLIRPITTYGSEIWISDFSQKEIIFLLKKFTAGSASIYLVYTRKLQISHLDVN